MRSNDRWQTLKRQARFEAFEERLALSAQPVGDFLLDASERIEHHYGELAPALNDAHETTGVNYVRDTFGFQGSRQTVAIIDSGIAYDHYALGEGLGSGYRVVGGWDFAEGDGNPYDDAPSGFHGTHVAGIVGSEDATYQGVAPEVDLVALRVFADDGSGYLRWVESALQWVHTNQNAFENPITTVNLSLGTDWNADTVPAWANLEEEFAQLEQDGIFISVSAGNSFEDFNQEPGLSYPAASPYVVPVASVDNDGSLSYFSQRTDRVLAAPGRSITSTVPDYVFGGDGIPNDFGTASGTSMAAPYVAGASVLVREAMDFLGYQDITQDMIYDHFRATADIVHDSITNADYHRISVRSALDALMPDDDYGSTVGTAYSLGTLANDTSLSGLIGTLEDVDYFTFNAGFTGKVSLGIAETYDLNPNVQLVGGGGSIVDEKFEFDVIAGETYSFSLGTTDGIGRYDMDMTVTVSQLSIVDWGDVEFQQIQDNQFDGGDAWFQMTATRGGLLTVEAAFAQSAGNVNLQIYNAQNQLLDSSDSTTDNERVDVTAGAGETFLLKVSGSNSDVNFRVTNLVSVANGQADIHGTSGDDVVQIVAATTHQVTVNGVRYDLNGTDVSVINVHGGGGLNEVEVTGRATNDTVTLRAGSFELVGSNYEINGTDIETTLIASGGGQDTATFYDSAGDDLFTAIASTFKAELSGSGFHNTVVGFSKTYAYASSGGSGDRAEFYDSAGDDRFIARGYLHDAYMYGEGYFNYSRGFETSYAYATAGGTNDRADLYDSAGDDHYVAQSNYEASMTGGGHHNHAKGFNTTYAFAISGGSDRADFYDSAGDDRFVARAATHEATMSSAGYENYARGFSSYFAFATAGGSGDRAEFFDSAGDDRFIARGYLHDAYMYGEEYFHYSRGFDVNHAYATAGGTNDRADLYDSQGDDHYIVQAQNDHAWMSGGGHDSHAMGFDSTYAFAIAGGSDQADFYDSSGDDQYVAKAQTREASMSGTEYYNFARGFSTTYAFATSGGSGDRANFYDSAGDDRFIARGYLHDAYMYGEGYFNYSRGFETSYAYATAGGTNDRADLYDSNGDDQYTVRAQTGEAVMIGPGYHHQANGFDSTYAFAIAGGSNDQADIYDSLENDQFIVCAESTIASMSGGGQFNYTRGFGSIHAFAGVAGGEDHAEFQSVTSDTQLTGSGNGLVTASSSHTSQVSGFSTIRATAKTGDSPSAELDALDYVLELLGDWNVDYV